MSFITYSNLPRPPGCILAIDPSLTSTGLACMRDHDGHPQMKTQVLKPPKMHPIDRLSWFEEHLLPGWGADFIVLEGYSHASKFQAHQLGELGGVLRLLIRNSHLPYMIVPPTTLKMFVTGKGNSKKSILVKELLRRWDVNIDQEDQADAAGLALFGLFKLVNPLTNNLIKPQMEALAKVTMEIKPRARDRSGL